MTEQEIKTEIDLTLSRISKFVISRSSRILSKEALIDGRILVGLSSLSILFCLGIIDVAATEISPGGLKVELKALRLFPIIIELVCTYFAINFWIDAFSDLKSWQFQSLDNEGDAKNPSKSLEEENNNISRQTDIIISEFDELVEQERRKLGLDKADDQILEANQHRIARNFKKSIEIGDDLYERLRVYDEIYTRHHEAFQIKLKEIDLRRSILWTKIKLFDKVMPGVNRMYKLKYRVNFIFPLFLFALSIFAMAYYLLN